MTTPAIHGKKSIYSASSELETAQEAIAAQLAKLMPSQVWA